jgi:phage shock protein C
MAVQMPSRLYRSRSQKMIAGVAGGLGEYFDVDPVLIRLLFVVTSFISGAGILAYIVLWIVIPVEGDSSPRMDALRRDFDDLSSRVRDRIDPQREPASPAAPSAATAAGATPESSTTPPTADIDPDAVLADDPASHRPAGYEQAAPAAGASGSASYADPAPDPAPDPTPPYDTVADPFPAAAPVGVDRRRRRQHWAGAMLIVVGLLILGNNLELLWWAQAKFVVPLIIVGAGAWLLFGMSRRG